MMKQIFLACSLLFFGCLGSSHGAMEVFVSIPPQKWVIDEVGATLVNTKVLVKEGQNPHTFEPSPRSIAALSRAKVWFTTGMEFEDQLQQKIKSVAPNLQIINITQNIERIAMGESEHEHEEHEHHKKDNESHHHEEKEHDEHHDHDGLDPHVWLSPIQLISMSEIVEKTLSTLDTNNSPQYKENLADARKKLTSLHKQISTKLAPHKGSSFFVFHPSFGYFADTYHLKQEAVEVEGKSPNPKQLSALIAKAKSKKVKVIFVQPQFDPKSAQAVAAAIDGEVVPLDALAEDVVGNLMNMAEKISAALAP